MCRGLDRFTALRHFNVFLAINDYHLNSNCGCEVCAYYDMRHKKLMWINRENINYEQKEVPLGIDATGDHAESIRERLQLVFG